MSVKNRLTINEAAGDYKQQLVRGLLFDLKQERLLTPVTEHEFARSLGRKWRFDAAYVEEKIAIEIEGGTGWKRDAPSRHLTPSGFSEDARKYNEASILGWVLIRLTPTMLRDGSALDFIERALKARRG